jgi:hypothetical protein
VEFGHSKAAAWERHIGHDSSSLSWNHVQDALLTPVSGPYAVQGPQYQISVVRGIDHIVHKLDTYRARGLPGCFPGKTAMAVIWSWRHKTVFPPKAPTVRGKVDSAGQVEYRDMRWSGPGPWARTSLWGAGDLKTMHVHENKTNGTSVYPLPLSCTLPLWIIFFTAFCC